MIDFDKLFDLLDLDQDEELSRKELHSAAEQLGWHWHEAPFFAVFDLLSLSGPIARKTFNSCLKKIVDDPLGPYGRVLLSVKYDSLRNENVAEEYLMRKSRNQNIGPETSANQIIHVLEKYAGGKTANEYKMLLQNLNFPKLSLNDVVLLIIDPQRSFTKGAWMKSIGSQAQQDIKAIESAFKHCAQLIGRYKNLIEAMFTRCPFPPDSYNWDDHFHRIIDEAQPYFIKPGNSILFPPTNGYRQWVEQILDRGKRILIIGGCTLNSCVRVSAIETRKFFKRNNLRVIADLSISGARVSNYLPSPMFGGLSSVESAIREMTGEGVEVVRGIDYYD
jgi:hypothetical protein